MTTEKRAIAGLALALAVVLLLSTFGAQRSHRASLPQVTVSTVQRSQNGSVAFPAEGVFPQGDGTCRVYRLTEEDGSFGIKRYYVKEVMVSTQPRPDGMLDVYGLYRFQDVYVTAASAPLLDGAEVLCLEGRQP